MPRRHPLRLLLIAAALLAADATGASPAGAQAPPAREPTVAGYDLGVGRFVEPGQAGRLARIPVKLWGAVGVPAGSGPAPVVIVAHGRHGDGCPGEYGDWPCFRVEQRNDLGMRYLVRALARAGFVAVVPDVNAAYTSGFGEATTENEHRRFNEIVDATLEALTTAGVGGANRFGVPLAGRVDATHVGLIGHSRGGYNGLDWAASRSSLVDSVVLVAPYFDPAERVPDVPTTLLLGTCDGDTGIRGAGYLRAARASTARTAASWRLVVRGANHNGYNVTATTVGDDAASKKGACAKAKRPKPAAQRAFLARVATDHFARTLLGAPAAVWQLPGARIRTLYGRTVALSADRVS